MSGKGLHWKKSMRCRSNGSAEPTKWSFLSEDWDPRRIFEILQRSAIQRDVVPSPRGGLGAGGRREDFRVVWRARAAEVDLLF